MEQKRGGKRLGSGRKQLPVTQKRTVLNVYPTNAELYKFGDKDKMKSEVLKFIANYGLQDLSKPTNEIKPYEQPKTDYQAVVQLINKSPYDQLKDLIKSTTTKNELEDVVKIIKGTPMHIKERFALEAFAKEHSIEFYND